MRLGRRPNAVAALEVLCLILLALGSLSFLASGERAPLGSDYGNIFLPGLFQARAALLDGSLLFWDAERYGGTPYWALPNTAPAYPPLLLALLLRGPIGATNLVLLAHLVAGAWGARALARSLGAGRLAAFAAAAVLLCAPLTRHYALNQPWATMAMAYLPWTLLLVVRQAGGADWRSAGIAAGLLWAATSWCGGYVVFLPGLMAVGLLAFFCALRRPFLRSLGRAAGMLALLLVVLVATSAGRLLPSSAWTELTNRSGGIALEDTVANALELGDLGDWILRPGFFAAALALAALVAGLARRRGAVLAGAATMLALLLLSTGLPQRAFLYEWAPGFDRIREPRTFWPPLEVLFAVLVALGLDLAAGWLARRTAWPAGLRAALGALAIALLCFESLRFGAVEAAPAIDSLEERVEANPLHRELARRAEVEPRFRVHDARDTRPKLKATANLLRSALGLESLEGVIGNVSILSYDLDLIGPSRVQGPRLWGLLNCVYVTSEKPLDEPELELVDTFEEDPRETFPGTDGPYLYRNRSALPRAYLAPRAILLLDAERGDRQRVLLSRLWSPRSEVLVAARSEELTDALLPRFHAVLDAGAGGGQQRARDLGVGAAALPPPGREKAELSELLRGAPAPIEALPDPERGWNRARVALPGAPEEAWLVLAETYAIYPGWRASVDGVEAPLLVANGAATAIPLPAGAREVVLRFTPPGLRAGMAISAAGLALSLLALWRLRARATRATRAS
jgi:hypothetical protein